MSLRNDIESALRSWDAYEKNRGAAPVIDFDCYPCADTISPVSSRIIARECLADLLDQASAEGYNDLAHRVRAPLAYLEALLGVRTPLRQYVQATQGCDAVGWSADYITAVGETARDHLAAVDVPWDATTDDALNRIEEPLDTVDAPDAVREAGQQLEGLVRSAVDSRAPFDLSVEQVDLDVYWAYWLDGVGSRVRMRINLRRASFTRVQARMFALHEILGHGLQCASYTQRCATDDVPWVRLTSVHAQQQVLLEGLAQALPLFVIPHDPQLQTRVRLKHYLQLVRSELHLAVNDGVSIAECVAHAQRRVPFWTGETIGDILTDRSADPLLRSYLWAYPAGIDWFVNLADHAPSQTISTVLRTAYRDPLTPSDLGNLWPQGPPIGGQHA